MLHSGQFQATQEFEEYVLAFLPLVLCSRTYETNTSGYARKQHQFQKPRLWLTGLASDPPSLFKPTQAATAHACSLTEPPPSYATRTCKITAPKEYVAIGVTVKIEIYIYILYVCTSNTALAFSSLNKIINQQHDLHPFFPETLAASQQAARMSACPPLCLSR